MQSGAREYPVGSGCGISDPAIGGRFVNRAQAEQRLEGGHRGPAAVVADDELVQVDLQVLVGGCAVVP
jgi:hypothetical protein